MNQTDEPQTQTFEMLALQPENFPVQGALYFLDGHYLFRYGDGKKIRSKFVTSKDLAAAFSQTEQDTGWITPGIVRMGSCTRGTWSVYSAPEQKVTIGLSEAESLEIPIPRTVWLGIEDAHFVWALKDRRFEPGAQAYHAPFPNVHPDGRICWGQNRIPKADPKKVRGIFELFFGSLFNGDLVGNKSASQPNDVRIALRELAEKKARGYPVHDLVPGGLNKIGSLIENKIKGA